MPSSDPDYRGMKRPLAVSAVTQRLSEQVYEHAKAGRCVLTLGGDHSIAIGTISGTAKAIRERLGGREMAVVWVDAHCDINTPETSGSGNIHGMPVAFLTGLAEEKRRDVFGWLQDDHKISVKKLVYIGIRDADRGEKKMLREHGIKAFSMHDVDKYGYRWFFFFGSYYFHADEDQVWHWEGHGDGSGSHWDRHPHTLVIRRRCTGSAMGAKHRYPGTRRSNAARRRLYCGMCA